MPQKKDTIAEKNARAAARGRYYEWLYRRFRSVQLLELIDSEPGQINLRQIFVPLRADRQDIDEERMTGPEKVNEENLPGKAVWDLLVQEPFLALSGRPGSGKTTVVHALVLELCGQHVSNLRKQLAQGRGIAPIPLILRNFPDLESIQTLEELLNLWWQEAEIQAKDDKLPLDIPRLKDSFDREKEAYPALLMFDGIDEVGGPEIRSRIFQMAAEAADHGFRVLLTGRPTGFQDLPELNGQFECTVSPNLNGQFESAIFDNCNAKMIAKIKLFHALPFAWKQIEQFIKAWYTLHNDWRAKREAGIENFLNALQNPRRSYLLTLARRPIFLTLMALVHCSRNEMPDGRGALYKAIIDLYLVRQEKHRQLKELNDGTPMPHWPDSEKRMVLGYLAYQSQIKGGEDKKNEPEKRRVIWKRDDMLQTIKNQLSSRKYGRFTELTPEDAENLLKYFLHPAGLLTEPEEERIQFAHLSFQEYLCADYLSGRCRRKYIEKELFSRLGKPGWDEVGLLLLTIRSEQERNEGHFEILSWLNLSDVHQAGLFIKAYSGRELPFTDVDLEEWLPVALGCALVHPEAEFVSHLSRLPASIQEQGIELLIKMFEADNAEEQWNALLNRLEKFSPVCIEDCLEEFPLSDSLKERWLNPKDDSSWYVEFDGAEARLYALFSVIATTGWAMSKKTIDDAEALVLQAESRLAQSIFQWLENNIKPAKPMLLWSRRKEEELSDMLPVPTNAGFMLDALLPVKGDLWKECIRCIPPDAWLLQGESTEGESTDSNATTIVHNTDYRDYYYYFNQAIILLTLYPDKELSVNIILSIGLYQIVMFLEGETNGQSLDLFTKNRSLSLSLSLFRSRSLSRSQSQFRSLSLSLSRSQSLSLPLSRSRPLLLSRSRSRPLPLFLLLPWSQSWSRSLLLSRSLRDKLEKVYKYNDYFPSEKWDSFFLEIEHFFYSYAAHDWFNEQAEAPDLMLRRGLRPGEPLPTEFNLFDNEGRPLPIQKRKNWVKLRQWLDDDEAVLNFFFPNDLPKEEHDHLLAQLQLTKQQPWSPQAGLDAVLTDWPENEPEHPYTMEHAEKQLEKACDEFLAKIEKEQND